MGKSVEDRDIKGMIINHRPGTQNPRIGVLEGTLHAREWISAATVTWIIKEFLTTNNTEIKALAENFEWHIFPVVNPDGYAYTFSHVSILFISKTRDFWGRSQLADDPLEISNSPTHNRSLHYKSIPKENPRQDLQNMETK